jgi:hypothetical protein
MVGIPRGRCSLVPGFGIHFRSTGFALYVFLFLFHSPSQYTAAIRCHGFFQVSPSTPGVPPPLLLVTRFTAHIRNILLSNISRCNRYTPAILFIRYSATSWACLLFW